MISAGGGAELLTKDSYYHYIRVKVTDKENYLEVMQLPSPPCSELAGRDSKAR
jgi:hypothetical protein